MQLTKGHKSKIVEAIMNDVPRIDYPKTIREYVQSVALSMMPPDVRAIYDNEETRPFLSGVFLSASGSSCEDPKSIYWRRKSLEVPYGHQTLYLSRPHWNDGCDEQTKTLVHAVHPAVTTWLAAAETQRRGRDSMRQKLQTMLAGIRTLKQAKTLLEPELHKYLPAEPQKDPAQRALQASTAVVPYVVANLREMGWPKDQEPKADAEGVV